MATADCESLVLSIQDINLMQQEFTQFYDDLFQRAGKSLRNAWTIKLNSMKMCQDLLDKKFKDIDCSVSETSDE